MKYRKLGNTGAYVSSLSFGTMFYGGAQWQATNNPVSREDGLACLKKAFDNGINYLDCADLYGAYGNAEKILGEFIKDYERSDFFISSKTFLPMSPKANDSGLSRKHIFESIDKSLARLGTDHIDLYYCHRYDFSTPLQETVVAMNDLIKLGKISYWGTSNWESSQLERAFGIAEKLGLQGPAVDQAKYSLLQRYSAEVELPYTMDYHHLGVVAYKVLADTFLTPQYAVKSIEDLSEKEVTSLSRFSLTTESVKTQALEILDKIQKLTDIAQSLGISLSQLAIGWVLQNKNVSSAIISTRKPSRIDENVKSIDIKIDTEIANKISTVLGNDPTTEKTYKSNMYWYHKKIVTRTIEDESIFPPSPDKF